MEHITSVNNQRIKDALKLRMTKYIKEENCFLIEGFHLLKEANLKSKIKTIFIEEAKIVKLPKDIKASEYFSISEHISEKMSSVKNSQGVFAIVEITNNLIDLDHNILILDNLQDPGNLGTLIRSAASFNFKTIINSFEGVSFYNDKVIRSTQGNLFQSNLVTEDLVKIIKLLKLNDYLIIGTTLATDHLVAQELTLDKNDLKYALIIGNEGQGVSEELNQLIDHNVLININESVESLNAAIAGSILMYEIAKLTK